MVGKDWLTSFFCFMTLIDGRSIGNPFFDATCLKMRGNQKNMYRLFIST